MGENGLGVGGRGTGEAGINVHSAESPELLQVTLLFFPGAGQM